MAVAMSERDFEILVGEALDLLPPEFLDELSNVVFLVQSRNPDDPHILGLYSGIALTRRTTEYAGVSPDTIEIYREPILAMCGTVDEVRHEVAVTVLHEVGHHFGIDDAWLHAHGWG